MIVTTLRTLSAAGHVGRYMVDPQHQYKLVDHNLPVSIEPPGTLPMRRTDPLAPQAGEGIDLLVRYIDDERKTYAHKRTIGDDAVAAMEARAALRPDIGRPFEHMVLAYAPEDRGLLTDDQIKGDVQGLIAALVEHDNAWKHARAKTRGHAGPARDLVPGDLQFVAATHLEKHHVHVHILLGRVAPDGELYYGARNALAMRRFCEKQELVHGLRLTGRNRHREGMTHDPERPKVDQPGVDSIRSPLRDQIEEIADQSATRDDLDAGLAAIGLRLEMTKRGHVVVDDVGTRTPASRVGLGGHRSPVLIGAPKSPTDVAREEVWSAAAASSTWDDFVAKLSKSGLECTLDRRGKVAEIHRLDVEGNKMAGRSWTPTDLGFKRVPDSANWRQPKGKQPREQRRPSSSDAQPREHVRLPTRSHDDDVFDRIDQLRADRDAIVARRAADHAEAVRIRAEAAKQRAEQTLQTQQRQAQETLLTQQQRDLQQQVRAALADDRDRSDAVPDRASSPSVDAPRPEPSSTPFVDTSVPDALPDADPPKPTFRMDR